MERPKLQIKNRIMVLAAQMATGGKVKVTDTFDNTVKESEILAIYRDATVILPDCIHTEYGIFDVIIKN